MPSFPSIRNPSFDLTERVVRPQLRMEFESGHSQARPRATVSVTIWELTWNSLSEADYQTLLTFFEANVGGTFDWTHPVSAVVYTVEFVDSQLESTIRINGYRDVNLTIQSVN